MIGTNRAARYLGAVLLATSIANSAARAAIVVDLTHDNARGTIHGAIFAEADAGHDRHEPFPEQRRQQPPADSRSPFCVR